MWRRAKDARRSPRTSAGPTATPGEPAMPLRIRDSLCSISVELGGTLGMWLFDSRIVGPDPGSLDGEGKGIGVGARGGGPFFDAISSAPRTVRR